jgi:hypothetical protein
MKCQKAISSINLFLHLRKYFRNDKVVRSNSNGIPGFMSSHLISTNRITNISRYLRSSYLKEFFDKPARVRKPSLLIPRKQIDPFISNEKKGTRFPDYTKLQKERDVYGELSWNSNFNVVHSKNNMKVHP